MDPVAATPTRPLDYAVLSASYAAAAGGVALLARRNRDVVPTHPVELTVLALGTSGLARVLAHEKVASWLRDPVIEEPAEGGRHPRGTGMRFAVGELLGCTRCLGSWSALALVGMRAASPETGRLAATLLGLSAVNDVVQAVITGTQATAATQEHAATRG